MSVSISCGQDKLSGAAEHPRRAAPSIPISCGQDKHSGAAEHPSVRRHRHRCLLAFLWLQGLEGTFGSMVRETDAFLSVVHLQQFVKQGQSRDAVSYLSRFLPSDIDSLSLEAGVLRRFLVEHSSLSDILDGNREGDILAAYFTRYRSLVRTICHGALRLRCIMLTALHAKQEFSRDSLDWERVRQKASAIVYDLVHKTPEVKGVVLLPASPLKPHDVLPIHFSSRQRCHRRKQRCRPRAPALAKRYLWKRGSLLSSSGSRESPKELFSKAANWMVDLLDERLKAGEHTEHPLQTGRKEGADVASVSQTMFGMLAGPAKIPGMPSVANEGAPVAPVTQITNLTSHGNSGTTKHSIQQGCSAENAHQGFNSRKNPRELLTTSDEQDLHPKRQQTTGAFGGTSLIFQ